MALSPEISEFFAKTHDRQPKNVQGIEETAGRSRRNAAQPKGEMDKLGRNRAPNRRPTKQQCPIPHCCSASRFLAPGKERRQRLLVAKPKPPEAQTTRSRRCLSPARRTLEIRDGKKRRPEISGLAPPNLALKSQVRKGVGGPSPSDQAANRPYHSCANSSAVAYDVCVPSLVTESAAYRLALVRASRTSPV